MNKTLDSYMKKALELYDLKELERLGLTPDLEQRRQILTFIANLLKWNKAAGLISPKDEAILFRRHFCDSLQPLLLFGFKKNASVLDVGAGGGFPSYPIRIFRPDLSFVLAESNRKKVSFLKDVKEQLIYDNVEIFNGRAERIDLARKFDYIVCRGLGSLKMFAEMAKPHMSPDGRMYTFKTKQLQKEIDEITMGKDKDGVRISEIAEYDLPRIISGLNLVALELLKK
jgi:16S rRNA (guanine527-N7)-methyltransferase